MIIYVYIYVYIHVEYNSMLITMYALENDETFTRAETHKVTLLSCNP